MIIRSVPVAIALYRYIRRDMRLLKVKGKMMNLRRIYESDKIRNLRRDLCLLIAPTESIFKLW